MPFARFPNGKERGSKNQGGRRKMHEKRESPRTKREGKAQGITIPWGKEPTAGGRNFLRKSIKKGACIRLLQKGSERRGRLLRKKEKENPMISRRGSA